MGFLRNVAVLALAVAVLAAPGDPPVPAAAADVGPGVRARLQAEPWVRVDVELTQPASARRAPLDRALLRRDVAAVQAGVLARLDAADFRIVHRYEGIAGFAGEVSQRGLDKLARHPDVVSVSLDGVGSGALAESVPLINADDVHALGITGAGVVVAVLDSGIDTDHPDLADAIAFERCYLATGYCPGGGNTGSGPGSAEDDLGHGSHVSGIITANGTVAPLGVAPGAGIAVYKVLDFNNFGFYTDWNVALSDIIANHPEVRAVNMSLGSFGTFGGPCDSYLPSTTNAIATLRNAGTLTFVASANNGDKSGVSFPACITGAISVGAVWDDAFPPGTFGCGTEGLDVPTCWSNYAPGLDLLAPGAATLSSVPDGTTATYFGTSMATPHAAGVAALLLDDDPSFTAAALEQRLEATGVLRTDPANGRMTPRVDALAALNATDGDADGMLDAWETWRPCLVLGFDDSAFDPDGDLIPNITEYALELHPCVADTEGDGCADGEEYPPLNADPNIGGDRDPASAWDFFDVPAPAGPAVGGDGKLVLGPAAARNGVVTLQDVSVILAYVGRTVTSAEYNADNNADGIRDGVQLDRVSSSDPGKPWRSGPPNNAVSLVDASVALAQVGDSCVAAP